MNKINDKIFLLVTLSLLILLMSCIILYIKNIKTESFKVRKSVNRKNGNYIKRKPTDKDISIVFYYAPWCPYCKEVYSIDNTEDLVWNQLEDYLAENKINDFDVKAYAVDCTKNKKKCKSIDSYPTIKFFKNGKSKKYTGERTYDDLIDFLKVECF